jgi:serine/threonine-protein kinase
MENEPLQSKPVPLSFPAKTAVVRPGSDARPPSASSPAVDPEDDQALKDSKQALLATEVIENPKPVLLGGPDGHYQDPLEESAAKPSELDDFLLLRKLGEGAMGTVFKARRLSTGKYVAVKVMFPHLARNAHLLERFYREARTMEEFSHPNIVRGYAVGEAKGWHYFAMEYVDGRSLQEWLNLLGKLSVGDALHIVLTCARTLGYIHDHQLIHRDIKPDNVLITRAGVIKITDLGVAKFLIEDLALTDTGNTLGTPAFMAPEQARNAKAADIRSDIYALGCMLYYCLSGQTPFSGDTLLALLQAKESGKYIPLRRLNPEVPTRLELIVDKMIARESRYRYPNCAEVIQDLDNLGRAAHMLSFIPDPDGTASDSSSTTPPPPTLPAIRLAEDIWYVSYRTNAGQSVTRKMTTEQVLALIETKDFDVKAKATRNPREGFRALACFREFEPGFLSRVARSAVDEKTTEFRSLYKQLHEEDRQRQRDRIRDLMRQKQPLSWPQMIYWFASRGLIVLAIVLLIRLTLWIMMGLFGS